MVLRIARSMVRALDLALPRRLDNQNDVPLNGTLLSGNERRRHDVDERAALVRWHDEAAA
jgi:hypothetical protein